MEVKQPVVETENSLLEYEKEERKALSLFWQQCRLQHSLKLRKYKMGDSDLKRDLDAMNAECYPDYIAARTEELREPMLATAPSIVSRPSKAARLQNARKGKPRAGKGIVKAVKTPQSTKQSRLKNNSNEDAEFEAQTRWGTTTEDHNPTGEAKIKAKTRGIPSAIDLDVQKLDRNEVTIAEVRVPVKKLALDIFTPLFSNREQGKRSLHWDSFLDAMSKVGFAARHSRGSAVAFKPTSGSRWFGLGSIAIHRPHPKSTIDSVVLLSIGKRMKKWFG